MFITKAPQNMLQIMRGFRKNNYLNYLVLFRYFKKLLFYLFSSSRFGEDGVAPFSSTRPGPAR